MRQPRAPLCILGRFHLPFCVVMKLSLHPELVPSHIDGFVLQTDGRISRFSAVGTSGGGVERDAERDGEKNSSRSAAPRVAEHSREELECTLVLRGRCQGLLGDQRFVLEAQHMLWIRPRQNRLLIDVSDDYLAWVLVFRPRLLRRVLKSPASAVLSASPAHGQSTFDRADVLLRRLSRGTTRELSSLFASLPIGAGRDVFNAGLGYALARAFLAFTRAEPLPQLADVHPAVRKAAWLLRDGHTELSNSELSSRSGLSAHRLSRLFKREMGTTLVEFRNRQRIERCLRALEASEPPELTDLALDVGFGSYTQFHRVFKQTMGMAPVQYLKQRRSQLR